ncbi:MAG: histidine triad nucleotide-binding protein [Dehalococcoidia bacterium]|nr:histidine triad nucleotide-binding protein [Dehalococcoidia bacterium]
MADCIFCRIIRGDIPGSLIYDDGLVVAFPDIYPKARVHILVVPREHITSIADIGPQHSGLLSSLVEVANGLAKQEGIAASGYRLVTNAGPDSGQEVQHLHVHLLGGEKLGGL